MNILEFNQQCSFYILSIICPKCGWQHAFSLKRTRLQWTYLPLPTLKYLDWAWNFTPCFPNFWQVIFLFCSLNSSIFSCAKEGIQEAKRFLLFILALWKIFLVLFYIFETAPSCPWHSPGRTSLQVSENSHNSFTNELCPHLSSAQWLTAISADMYKHSEKYGQYVQCFLKNQTFFSRFLWAWEDWLHLDPEIQFISEIVQNKD